MFTEIALAVASVCVFGLYYVVKANKRDRIDLRGKHVVVTGGSSGIGLEICKQVFDQGAHVTILARNMARLKEIQVELETKKKNNQHLASQIVQIESIDISQSYENTQKVFEKIASVAGPVDVLINNAGIFKASECTETPVKDFEDMMRINYMGTVFCTKAVLPAMKERKFGRIVFVSSQAGQCGVFGYTAYSSTKFALRGFAEALQMEVKPYNVFITINYPPDTDTPGLKEENMHKPQETRLIAEGSGILSSKSVASEIIKSVKKGEFTSYFGINGFLLSCLTAGTTPAVTFKEALTQIVMLPLCRTIAFFVIYGFDSTVKSCYNKKAKK